MSFLKALTVISLPCLCCLANAETVKKNPPLPYGEWTYVFVYPNVFFSEVTYVRFLDTNGYLNENPVPDMTTPDKKSVNTWREDIERNFAIANKGTMPPQWIQFCWDSQVDKKSWETTITFQPKIWALMRQAIPAGNGNFYHDNMVIGLAPQGNVRVWFNTPENQGGKNIVIADAKTVSGDSMTLCKNKSAFKSGFPDSKKIDAAIQGKHSPYGNW